MTEHVIAAEIEPVTEQSAERLVHMRSPVGIAAAILLGVIILLAVAAPWIWGESATRIDTDSLAAGSSANHWIGTDNLGRDLLARVLVATRLSVLLAIAATTISVLTGLLLGCAPWLLGDRLGGVVVGAIDIAVAFPYLLLALFFAVVFGVGTGGAVVAIGLAAAPYYARVVHTLISGVRERDFVSAAWTIGLGRLRILVRHILPNVAETLVVYAMIGAAGSLVAFAGLSFLGLGVQAPSYDWGLLLNEGLSAVYVRPLGALGPGVAIVIAGLAFNLFGEVLAKGVGHHRASTNSGKSYSREPEFTHEIDVPRSDDLVSASNLRVVVGDQTGNKVVPVRDIDLRIRPGERVGIVGESGSGKSLTAMSLARLIDQPLQVHAADLRFMGQDLLEEPNRKTRATLRKRLSVVFQDPSTSLNPTMRIGRQLTEVLDNREDTRSREERESRAIDSLRAVRIPNPALRIDQYPHEFSGGMRQRGMIAMSLMGDPALIIADEPTTALDTTVQMHVLQLLMEISVSRDAAILLISHDITVVSQFCERVMVMYAGRVVEELPAGELRSHARHPYTRALMDAVPTMQTDRDHALATIPGSPPPPSSTSIGCAFAPRCSSRTELCTTQLPPLTAHAELHRIACWNPILGPGDVDAEAEGGASRHE